MVLLTFTFAFLVWMPDWVNGWVNYPGLELWKFVNLLIFITCALYLHRRFGRPIREALRSRGERIKHELSRAQEEKDQALAKLAEVEKRFGDLDAEVARITERAKEEAAAERERISVATKEEIARIRDQAKREVESAGKAARHELRKVAAMETVRLAEEILRLEINPEDDARLTSRNVRGLGGLRV